MSENDNFTPFIDGETIYLRLLMASDVTEKYCTWMNDSETIQFLESRYFPNSKDKIAEFVKKNIEDDSMVFMAIIEKEEKRHIGNIKLGPINWIHRLGDIGIIIGEKDCRGKGYASESISLLSAYAFNTLNLHKLTAGCFESNIASAKAFQKCGFEPEGLLKQHAFYKGYYENVILMGLIT